MKWLTIVAAFAAPLCGSPARADGPTGPVVYERSAPSVLLIRAYGIKADDTMDGETGSGFIVSSDGRVLTASHVIPDETKYKNVIIGGTPGPGTASGKAMTLKLEQRSTKYDVAVLRVVGEPAPLTPLSIRRSAVKVGERVLVLGYPLGLPDTHFLDGSVGDVEEDAITTNALVDKGNSGGPVLDANGCVVGVLYGGITSRGGEPVRGIKFAVPINSIRDLVPNVSTTAGSIEAKSPDVIHSTDTLSRTQTDHTLFRDTVKAYHDVIASQPGYLFDVVEGVGHNSLNPPSLQYPEPIISPDRKTLLLNYSLLSGPIGDARRGWIDMTINTRQRRQGAGADAGVDGSCG